MGDGDVRVVRVHSRISDPKFEDLPCRTQCDMHPLYYPGKSMTYGLGQWLRYQIAKISAFSGESEVEMVSCSKVPYR